MVLRKQGIGTEYPLPQRGRCGPGPRSAEPPQFGNQMFGDIEEAARSGVIGDVEAVHASVPGEFLQAANR